MSTRDVGARGESAAAAFLEGHGYRIVQRNYRVRGGEIDLVCEEGDVLCFVEVRSRADARFGTPEETIGRIKRRRIARAAQKWLTAHRREEAHCRFDVVVLEGNEIRLIQDAFRLEDC